MLQFYIKSALRGISRRKLFSALNIAGLGIGISVFLLTLQYYSFETGFNGFHPNGAALYRVNTSASGGRSFATYPMMTPMLRNIPGVKNAARFADNFNSGAIVSYQPEKAGAPPKVFREEDGVFADKAFLDAFHFPFVEGINQLSSANAVVITASVAKKLFGAEKAEGRIIRLHNQFGDMPFRVSGVIADVPVQSDIRFSYLFSLEILNNPVYTAGSDWAKPDSWSNNSYTTYAELDEHANPAAVAATATRLWQQQDPNYKKEDGSIVLQPLSQLHLGGGFNDTNPTYGSRAMVYFILALGILVLCIAWINYINFSTAYALSQAKNIGIQKIIGSGRRQIVWRYLVESLLLNIGGLFIAFLLISSVQQFYNYLAAKPLSLAYINSWSTWLMGTGIMIAGIVLCGGYMGYLLSRIKPVNALQYTNAGHTGHLLLRKGLVVFQFAASILFIACTLIAYEQIGFMKHHDLGMNINGLVVIDGPQVRGSDSSFRANSTVFRNELAMLPFVEKFSSDGSVPGLGSGHNFNADGVTRLNPQKGDASKSYAVSIVDEHYLDTYSIPLLCGRNFTAADVIGGFKGDKIMVNETAARALGFEPAAALHQFVQWNHHYEIVGVVKDYHHLSLKEKIEPILFIPARNNSCYTVKMAETGFAAKMARIKTLYEKLYPGNPFAWHALQDTYDTQYADEQRAGVIALSISSMVILIACLGLIGLSVFTARRRNKEIGIRKVLGAGTGSLFALLSREFLWLVFIAFLVATPLAWWAMNKWLQEFAYRISISAWVFAVAGAISLLIALCTVSLQALRAAMANPVDSLRTQ